MEFLKDAKFKKSASLSIKEALLNAKRDPFRISSHSERTTCYKLARLMNLKIAIQKQTQGWVCFILDKT